MANKRPLVNYNGSIQEIGNNDTIPISNGGTGATTAQQAINNLLPSQSDQSGKFLKTDGTNAYWAPIVSEGGGSGDWTLSLLLST